MTRRASIDESPLSEAIEARIEKYANPRSLDADLAARVLPPLKALVRAARPNSPEHAKNLLAAGCALVADVVDRRGERAVAVLEEVFTDDAVAAWSHRATGTMAPTSRSHYQRWMNRLVRAAKGLPPRARPSARSSSDHPTLDAAVLSALLDSIEADTSAAAALVAAIGAGVVPAAVEVSIAVDDTGQPVVVVDGRRHPVTRAWADRADRLVGVVADPVSWRRMVTAARAADLSVGPMLLRRRWAIDALAEARCLAEALTLPMGRELLGTALAHQRPEDPSTVRDVLRG